MTTVDRARYDNTDLQFDVQSRKSRDRIVNVRPESQLGGNVMKKVNEETNLRAKQFFIYDDSGVSLDSKVVQEHFAMINKANAKELRRLRAEKKA